MKIFHHNDLDGKCAGLWVNLSAGLDNLKHPNTLIEIDYKDTFPIDSILPDEQIYIVDFSIEPEMMEQLLKITKNVTWIDHHKTAIEKYKDFPHEIRGVRYDGVAGCMLTYCYLHHMTARGKGPIKPFKPEMVENAPHFTKLIADWDVWTFEYGDETRHFQMGCVALDLNPSSKSWNRFFNDDGTQKTVDKGKIITGFRDEWAKDYMKGLGFTVVFEGFKCFAVNLGRCNSEYFKSIKDHDILMPFAFDGNKYTVSLYSTFTDVSVIAKKHGGGGHKGAAGFVCESLPFSNEN